MKNETRDAELLRQAVNEIRRLRHDNDILYAKSMVVDAFAAALRAEPARQGMSTDLVWDIERHLNSTTETEHLA